MSMAVNIYGPSLPTGMGLVNPYVIRTSILLSDFTSQCAGITPSHSTPESLLSWEGAGDWIPS